MKLLIVPWVSFLCGQTFCGWVHELGVPSLWKSTLGPDQWFSVWSTTCDSGELGRNAGSGPQPRSTESEALGASGGCWHCSTCEVNSICPTLLFNPSLKHCLPPPSSSYCASDQWTETAQRQPRGHSSYILPCPLSMTRTGMILGTQKRGTKPKGTEETSSVDSKQSSQSATVPGRCALGVRFPSLGCSLVHSGDIGTSVSSALESHYVSGAFPHSVF
jgi:hypothetical protein